MTKRVFTVLAIDGGGVKGIVPARLLQELEERTGKPISELFDLVAGTSTGSIIAGCLTMPSEKDKTKPRFTAKQAVDFYLESSKDIFPESMFRSLLNVVPGTTGFYDVTVFEKILEGHLGDVTFKDALTNLMMAGADMKVFEPVWMHYFVNRNKSTSQRWATLKTRDAIRASTSAPTFFEAKYIYTHPNSKIPDAAERHAMLDGGLFAGTIARRALTQAKKLAPPDAKIIVVHLGTGRPEVSLTPNEMNQKNRLDWVRSQDGTSILGISTEMTVQDIVNDVKEELGEDFFRFNRTIDKTDPNNPDSSMDNSHEDNLNKLLGFAEKMIEEQDQKIDRLCKILQDKLCIDQLYINSRHALSELSETLTQIDDPKALSKLYTKIAEYTSDIEDPKVPEQDQDLFNRCKQLTDRHKDQLKTIYTAHHNALLDLSKQNKRSFWSHFNFWSKRDKKHPENSNDNNSASTYKQKKTSGKPKP